MQATSHSTTTDARRAGALWVAAVGASLVLVAASVFIAVHWDTLGVEAKLAGVCTITIGLQIAGLRSEHSIPATSTALFHLGALLVPVDLAAGAIVLGMDPGLGILFVSVPSGIAFVSLGRVRPSWLLRTSAWLAVVGVSAGVGATTPVPTSAALLAAATCALAAKRREPVLGWTLVAGLGPVLALAEPVLAPRARPAAELGLVDTSTLVNLAVGLVAVAIVLAEARLRWQPDLVLVGLGILAVDATLAVGEWLPSGPDAIVAVSAVFLLVELTALALRRDPFWSIPLELVAALAEIGTTIATVALAAAAVLVGWLDTDVAARAAVAASLVTVTWLVADLRRRHDDVQGPLMALLTGAGWAPATVGFGSTATATVALASGDVAVTSIGAIGVVALLVLSGRPAAHLTATALVAAVNVLPDRSTTIPAVLAGAALLTIAARWRLEAMPESTATAGTLAIAALGSAAHGAARMADHIGLAGAALVWIAIAWTIGSALDRPGARPSEGLGMLPRSTAAAALLVVPSVPPLEAALVAGAITCAAITEATLRRDEPIALLGSLSGALSVLHLALAAGLALPRAGVTVGVAAVVLAALAVLAERSWYPALAASAALAAVIAVAVAAGEQSALSDLLLIWGLCLVAGALALPSAGLVTAGLAVATLGTWLRLAHAGVGWNEAYVAPLALILMVNGHRERKTGASSWLSYGPAIALLGGTALHQRIMTGAPSHAFVAGAVGGLSLVLGARFRLAGPLFLGSVIVAALAAHQVLVLDIDVPAWVWLGLFGSALLAAAALIERGAAGPLETGRRIVDEIAERFS